MKRIIILIVAVVLLAVAGYIVFFRWGDAKRTAGGYKKADTPQVCAEMFRKAIREREYDIAADYVTQPYAEQLKKGAEPGKELGKSIDNLTDQLNSRGLMRDELQLVLFALDPFPKEVEITTADETTSTPKAVLVIAAPKVGASTANSGKWNLKPEMLNTLVPTLGADRVMRTNKISFPMKKDGEVWKIDVSADTNLQTSVTTLKDKYKNFVNPLDDVKENLKTDATTKENVAGELKRMLEQASKE